MLLANTIVVNRQYKNGLYKLHRQVLATPTALTITQM
ncbi:MAG: hypothetical protein ACJASB_000874 [Shewanella psychromarinicola]|jgi:hypothetical protein